jgi:hypothetical protein
MKRTISTIVLLFTLAVSSLAQTVPQIYYPDGHDYEMTVQNTSAFGQGQFGSDPAQDAYFPLCNGLRETDFRVNFLNPNAGHDVKYLIEIYEKSFNPADGTPSFLTLTNTNGGLGSDTKVYTSVEITTNSSSGTLSHDANNIYVNPNHYYYALIYHKRKILGIWQATWGLKASNNINFVNGNADTDASGSINTTGNVTMGSLFGNVTVGVFDLTQNVILNATATSCEDRYGVQIEEFNLSTWTAVPGTQYNSNWIMGQAPAINLSAVYLGFAYGKVYRVVLYAGLTWSTEQFFITPKAAVVSGNVNSTTQRQLLVLGTNYIIDKISDCETVNLSTNGTLYASKYKIDIDQVNSTTLAVIAGTNFSTNWITTAPPASISLSSLYNFGPSMYRVVYRVGNPEVSKTLYIEFNTCSRREKPGEENGGITGIQEKEFEEFNIYPNPSTGIFEITSGHTKDVIFEVFDMQGRSIRKGQLKDKTSYQLDLSGFTKGTYLLMLNSEGKTQTRKLILQ